MEKCSHPNIIGYRHSWLETGKIALLGAQTTCLFVLMDYANQGSLEAYVKQHTLSESDIWNCKKLSPNPLTQVFVDVLHGLDYLHSHDIVHRDIKVSDTRQSC